MNLYFWIILTALLTVTALRLWSVRLNLRSLSDRLPEEFRDVYDAAEYARSQRYTRERSRFGIRHSLFDLAILLAFWFAGGFPWLHAAIGAFGLPAFWSELLFVAALAAGSALLDLPFTLYSTFVIEERYGFNRTTLRTFVTDRLKGLGLALLLGLPLLAAVLAFFTYGGALAWMYTWIAAALFMIAMQYVAPTWIMPLFNRFTPLGDGPLRDELLGYAERVRFPLRDIAVMDGSRRSGKGNAFFTGFGRSRRIALYDTLIGKHDAEEVTSIVAHEIGHYRRRHILIGLLLGIGEAGLMLFLLSLFIRSQALAEAFFMPAATVGGGLVFFGLLYTPLTFVLSLATSAMSRKHEFEADRYAVQTYRKPEVFIRALKTLTKEHLANVTPHPLYVFLNYSHPPLLERIDAIRRTAGERVPRRRTLRLRLRDLV